MQKQESYALKIVAATIVLYAIFTFFTGCAPARYRFVSPRPVSVVAQPASLQQCAYGGVVVIVGSSITVRCNAFQDSPNDNCHNNRCRPPHHHRGCRLHYR